MFCDAQNIFPFRILNLTADKTPFSVSPIFQFKIFSVLTFSPIFTILNDLNPLFTMHRTNPLHAWLIALILLLTFDLYGQVPGSLDTSFSARTNYGALFQNHG
jgi:hypothetical protein